MAGSIHKELLAWESLLSYNKAACLIPLTIFWILWKERNNCVFEGIENTLLNVRDKWLHYFGSLFLGHNLLSIEDIGAVVNMLIDMKHPFVYGRYFFDNF